VTVKRARKSVLSSVEGLGVGRSPARSDEESLGRQTVALEDQLRFAELDEYVVMPNHVHLILALFGTALGVAVGGFKARVTRTVRLQGVWGPDRALWQRGNHDRLIRTPAELERARNYVRTNPLRWPR